MKSVLFFLSFFILATFTAFSSSQKDFFSETQSCFLFYDVNEHNTVFLHNPRESQNPASPCSSFKLPLAFMGYDAGILKDENTPLYCYEEGDEKPHPFIAPAKGPLSPKSWMTQSAVWYSQVLARKLGIDRITQYLASFEYGNQDMSGDPEKNNGLTNAWLCSSLLISVDQQINFLDRLLSSKRVISHSAFEQGKKILLLNILPNGWSLYGKTGSGYALGPSGSYDPNIKQGWFVGWIEKDARYFAFASKQIFPGPESWSPDLLLYGAGKLTRERTIKWLEDWCKER